MRTKANIMTLSGHTNTVADVKCQAALPEVRLSAFSGLNRFLPSTFRFYQVITASHDCTIRLWDLASGKTRSVLTNHKKSIRSIALHPTQSVVLQLLYCYMISRLFRTRTQKVRGPRWGQDILRRGRVTKAYERKNYKFKGPLPTGLGK